MKVLLQIDGVMYSCVPMIVNKERRKDEIANRFIEFEQGMKEYGISELISVFYKHILSHWKSLTIMYLVSTLDLTRDDTRTVLALAKRSGLLTTGSNCRYTISSDKRETILSIMKERSEA